MQFGKRTFLIFAFGSVTTLVVTSLLAGYYYILYQNSEALIDQYEAVTMRVNLVINYGNNTIVWRNKTIVPLGYNLLNATRLVAKVNSTYWPTYQASSVDAINGVANNSPYYWMWLYWDENKSDWEYGQVGADRYVLKPNETVMWRYEIQSYS